MNQEPHASSLHFHVSSYKLKQRHIVAIWTDIFVVQPRLAHKTCLKRSLVNLASIMEHLYLSLLVFVTLSGIILKIMHRFRLLIAVVSTLPAYAYANATFSDTMKWNLRFPTSGFTFKV